MAFYGKNIRERVSLGIKNVEQRKAVKGIIDNQTKKSGLLGSRLCSECAMATNHPRDGCVIGWRGETVRRQDFFMVDLGLNPRSVAY